MGPLLEVKRVWCWLLLVLETTLNRGKRCKQFNVTESTESYKTHKDSLLIKNQCDGWWSNTVISKVLFLSTSLSSRVNTEHNTSSRYWWIVDLVQLSKPSGAINCIYSNLCKRVGLCTRIKLTLCQTFIRPIIRYGAPKWITYSTKAIEKCEVF